MSGYAYDQAFEQERARLAGMEAQWDPATFRHIEALGLPAQASCWEIGGGGGSVAAWLAERVEHLLVTDVDTRFVEPLASGHVTVQRHDIRCRPATGRALRPHPRAAAARAPPDRNAVLDRLVDVLRPGGWLLIEDYDWTAYGADPASEVAARVSGAVIEVVAGAGFDPYFGRRLLREFRARGLAEASPEGRPLVMGAEHPGTAFYRLSLMSLRDVLVSRGTVSDADVDDVLAEMDHGDPIIISPIMFAALGRLPPTG